MKDLARQAQSLKAAIREHGAKQDWIARRDAAERRWRADLKQFGCAHAYVTGIGAVERLYPGTTSVRTEGKRRREEVQAFVVADVPEGEPYPYPTYIASLERVVEAHRVYHADEHVAVVPSVVPRGSAEDVWQVAGGD